MMNTKVGAKMVVAEYRKLRKMAHRALSYARYSHTGFADAADDVEAISSAALKMAMMLNDLIGDWATLQTYRALFPEHAQTMKRKSYNFLLTDEKRKDLPDYETLYQAISEAEKLSNAAVDVCNETEYDVGLIEDTLDGLAMYVADKASFYADILPTEEYADRYLKLATALEDDSDFYGLIHNAAMLAGGLAIQKDEDPLTVSIYAGKIKAASRFASILSGYMDECENEGLKQAVRGCAIMMMDLYHAALGYNDKRMATDPELQ